MMYKKITFIVVCLIISIVAQKPSDRLDVTNWKITMPYDTDTYPGNPDEIFQPLLENFEDQKYYYDNPNGAGVVFMANCGAATTTNSTYPRCEYREMRMDDNTDEASWSIGDGKFHKMEIIQAITHLPEVKPHVVAGQIHDADDDLTVFRLEGKKLFVDLNGDDGPVLTDNYKLGDVFTVAFIAGNGKVTYEYNGEPVRDDQGDIFELDCGNVSGCYFKAGCYTQSNVDKGDKPDAYGEVIIYSFFVSHGNEIHTNHTNTSIIPSTSSSVNRANNMIRTDVNNAILKVQFTLSEPQPIAITVSSVNGSILQSQQRCVKGAGNYCESISLKDFSSGIYLVRVTMNSRSFVEPFILMH